MQESSHTRNCSIDSPILTFITSHRVGWLTTALRAISLPGAGPVVARLVVGRAWPSAAYGTLGAATHLAVASGGAEILSLQLPGGGGQTPPAVAIMASVLHGYGSLPVRQPGRFL